MTVVLGKGLALLFDGTATAFRRGKRWLYLVPSAGENSACTHSVVSARVPSPTRTLVRTADTRRPPPMDVLGSQPHLRFPLPARICVYRCASVVDSRYPTANLSLHCSFQSSSKSSFQSSLQSSFQRTGQSSTQRIAHCTKQHTAHRFVHCFAHCSR